MKRCAEAMTSGSVVMMMMMLLLMMMMMLLLLMMMMLMMMRMMMLLMMMMMMMLMMMMLMMMLLMMMTMTMNRESGLRCGSSPDGDDADREKHYNTGFCVEDERRYRRSNKHRHGRGITLRRRGDGQQQRAAERRGISSNASGVEAVRFAQTLAFRMLSACLRVATTTTPPAHASQLIVKPRCI